MIQDGNHSPIVGAIYLCSSFIAGFFGWIGWTSMEEWLKFISLLVSMAAGVMAIRYYVAATKEKNIAIKKAIDNKT